MKHGYVYELEAEVVRLHRRRMWPVWVAAGLVTLLCGAATLEHHWPRSVPFVAGEMR